MKQEIMLSLFALARIDTSKQWEIRNKYWPPAYVERIANSPWWLVKTTKGIIEIGWRKRVISIDWSDTDIRKIVTLDQVTKDETSVHAYSEEDAITYLKSLAEEFK